MGATSEGEAVAIAAGAWLAGRKTVVMCQNSGLGNAVNPLTSLSFPFRIPTLLVVTWRGQPGIHDEPQHELMGQVTGRLLDTMRIPHRAFPETIDGVAQALAEADAEMTRSELPFGLVMAKDAVDAAATMAKRTNSRLCCCGRSANVARGCGPSRHAAATSQSPTRSAMRPRSSRTGPATYLRPAA